MDQFSIFNILNLVAGLALFLFGMSLMGEALERRAGKQLKSVLSKLTTNKYKGFLLGLVVTSIIQSSSATTVMVVGFVNSGIMALSQSISVMMGANVGTTVTAWILSLTGIEGSAWYIEIFKPSSFTPILAVIGCVMYCFLKDKNKKYTGMILLGFSVLIYGMDMMSNAVKPLAQEEGFRNAFLLFRNPILGVVVGAVLTAIIQSSSASVGILQMLSVSGAVTIGSAIPIIMGQNIGTCITAILSSIGANKNARRAAFVHLYTKIINTIVSLTIYSILNAILNFTFVDIAANPMYIAVIHTTFNIFGTIVFFPFTKQLEMLARFTIRDGKKEEVNIMLDERFLATPAIAVNRSKAVAINMAEMSADAIEKSFSVLKEYNKDLADDVRKAEGRVDEFEDKLGSYLVKLSSRDISEEDSRESSKLLHLINDFERISDHAVNIVESSEEIRDKQLSFSEEAVNEIGVMMSAVSEIIDLAVTSFINNDLDKAYKVEPLEEVIDDLKVKLKNQHIKRLQRNECTIELGFVLTDIITNLERVSDHCSNIAGCVIEIAHKSLDIHQYTKTMQRGEGSEFEKLYKEYFNKYSINEEQ